MEFNRSDKKPDRSTFTLNKIINLYVLLLNKSKQNHGHSVLTMVLPLFKSFKKLSRLVKSTTNPDPDKYCYFG